MSFSHMRALIPEDRHVLDQVHTHRVGLSLHSGTTPLGALHEETEKQDSLEFEVEVRAYSCMYLCTHADKEVSPVK